MAYSDSPIFSLSFLHGVSTIHVNVLNVLYQPDTKLNYLNTVS